MTLSICSFFTIVFFFFQAEDGIRDRDVTGVQTCALPIFSISKCSETEKRTTENCDQRSLVTAIFRHCATRRTWMISRSPAVQYLDRQIGRNFAITEQGFRGLISTNSPKNL